MEKKLFTLDLLNDDNNNVRVDLVKKDLGTILRDTLDIVENHAGLYEIIGIYLVGSHARGEESNDSDIDVLVISADTDREMIHDGTYNILIISERLLEWKLENDLLPIGTMLKEARALINSSYVVNLIEIKVTKKNVKWYIDTTKEKLELLKEILESTAEGKIPDRVAYSLVLRIRTLYIIQKLIKNQNHSKKELIKLISRISGSNNAYGSYVAVKNDDSDSYKTEKKEAEKLYRYLMNILKETIALLD